MIYLVMLSYGMVAFLLPIIGSASDRAVQVVIDLAVSSRVRLGLSSPATYADAFRLLARAGLIPAELAERLGRAAGFRNVVADAYGRTRPATCPRRGDRGDQRACRFGRVPGCVSTPARTAGPGSRR
jgi:hypothetical protein